MKRTASAHWVGDGMTGKGDLTTQSGALRNQGFSFKTRFESEDGKAGCPLSKALATVAITLNVTLLK